MSYHRLEDIIIAYSFSVSVRIHLGLKKIELFVTTLWSCGNSHDNFRQKLDIDFRIFQAAYFCFTSYIVRAYYMTKYFLS